MENKQATWIWYPGDFEVWLGNICNNRRTERGALFPPFWKQDSHWPTVVFSKTVDLNADETATIRAEGSYSVFVDGQLLHPPQENIFPKGRHTVSIKVWNQVSPPALYLEGTHLKSDDTWQATFEDKIWIDENGEAHGAGVYVPVGSWNFNSPDRPPSRFRLERKEQRPVSKTDCDAAGKPFGGTLYDFGREVFGSLKLIGLNDGNTYIYYGESREEALDKEHCETLDFIYSDDADRWSPTAPRVCHLDSKAFRFVYIETSSGAVYDVVAADLEYAPFDAATSGSFRCSDELLNRIWDVSAYTLDLTTREFFVDGIKRDRWTWSGDAIQSYLMNYYLRFDSACVRRTIRQLRGKDPVTSHVNTIMDYTFYWFKSIMDYYLYTGDTAFVREVYPRMKSLMAFCLARTNGDGLAEGQRGDWIFVDWVDFPMHKRGTLCFEQILFWKALQTMARCASLLRDCPVDSSFTTDACNYASDAKKYDEMAENVRMQTRRLFWSDDAHALMHAVEDGAMNAQITRFPNMFAIIYDFATPAECDDILHHVLLNKTVPPITTPYMRFYELEALCQMECYEQVLQEMRAYWGGMLNEGATTFWEKYNPEETGKQHLAMYGRPYGKSLCHAWGASPLYLLGRYFLGVSPTRPGYEEYEVRPVLGGLEWMEGDVPTPHGPIHVSVDGERISVRSHGGRGRLVYGSEVKEILPNVETVIDIKHAKI